MTIQDSSRLVIQQLHLHQSHQNTGLKEIRAHSFKYYLEGINSYSVRLHSFIVDWQIPESLKDEEIHSFLPT